MGLFVVGHAWMLSYSIPIWCTQSFRYVGNTPIIFESFAALKHRDAMRFNSKTHISLFGYPLKSNQHLGKTRFVHLSFCSAKASLVKSNMLSRTDPRRRKPASNIPCLGSGASTAVFLSKMMVEQHRHTVFRKQKVGETLS